MIGNTADGSTRPPALRCYLNLMTMEDLPANSAAPATREAEPLFEAILGAGYQGVQFTAPATAAEQAACARLGLGKAVETHRATIFQDLWRTVEFVRRFPELRFNGDFSHWYTGLEMVYGGFENKLQFIRPVLDRVRFIHGRIGNPGSIQVDVGQGDPAAQPYVGHFQSLWTACFEGFLKSARQGDYILFVPELLSPRIYYGRLRRTDAGSMEEETDRWTQSLVLRRIAMECFAAAQAGPRDTR